MRQKGRFIVFEGLDGSGKTSVIEELKKIVKEEGLEDEIIFTREPGGMDDKLTESIRNVIMDHDMDPLTEAYLFASSRARHCKRIYDEVYKNGKTVISDRFVFSSIYYQGVLKNLGSEKVYDINKHIVDDIISPDTIIYLSVSPEIRANRLTNRDEHNRLDDIEINVEDPNVGYFDCIKKYKREDAVLVKTVTDEHSPREIAESLVSFLL